MKKIELYEVGPRDGFQMVDEYIPLETKVRIIEGLLDAGLRHLVPFLIYETTGGSETLNTLRRRMRFGCGNL